MALPPCSTTPPRSCNRLQPPATACNRPCLCLPAQVGLSGSGKTTVCALLQRLYDPSGGRLVLDADLDVRDTDAAWYRQQIGVVPQEPRLFSRSIAANIAYGMEHAPPSAADIEEAARAANAHDFIMSLPQVRGGEEGRADAAGNERGGCLCKRKQTRAEGGERGVVTIR